jgi:hypothetical protein
MAAERLKTLLLCLLAPLTVFLAAQAWSGVGAMWEDAPDGGVYETSRHYYTQAALPQKIAQMSGGERTAVMWQPELAAGAMARLSVPLSEALGSAGSPFPLSAEGYADFLAADGVYLEFSAPVPLQALGAWFSVNCPLEGSARAMLLSRAGEAVTLCYEREDGSLYAALTASRELPELSLPQDCYFAFEASPALPAQPAAFTLLPRELPRPAVLAAAAPADTRLSARAFLTLLGFDPNTPFRYTSRDGTQNYVDYKRQCLVSPDGRVYYADPYGEGRGTRGGSAAEAADFVEESRRLAEAFAPALGGAVWALTEAGPWQGGYRVLFGAQYGGVDVEGEGAAHALFIYRNGLLEQAHILLRSYSPTEESEAFMPLRQSLAAAGQAPGFRLWLAYDDGGGDTAAPRWFMR